MENPRETTGPSQVAMEEIQGRKMAMLVETAMHQSKSRNFV